MSEELKEMERLKDLFVSQMEAEERAFLEERKRTQEWDAQDLADQIEAGLVDAEKLSKYVGIRWKRSEDAPAQPPAPADEAIRDAAELEYREDVFQYRSWSTTAYTAPGGWGCFVKKPLASYGNSSGTKCESVVKGSYADLVASAKGDTQYKYDDKKKLNVVDKVVVKSGSAAAIFIYKVPSGCIPPYGGRIKVYPIWNLLGEYCLMGNPWNLYKDYMAELELALRTAAYPMSASVKSAEAKQVLLKREANLSAGAKFEWAKILKYAAHVGPAVEVDVVGGKDVMVVANLQLYCKAGGDLGQPYGNYAKLDFSSYKYHAELEELRVEPLKVNPPPKTATMAKPPSWWEPPWQWETVDPDLLKPKGS